MEDSNGKQYDVPITDLPPALQAEINAEIGPTYQYLADQGYFEEYDDYYYSSAYDAQIQLAIDQLEKDGWTPPGWDSSEPPSLKSSLPPKPDYGSPLHAHPMTVLQVY
jgi:hypothetical protein